MSAVDAKLINQRSAVAKAWGVHLFTALGLVLAVFATLALIEHQIELMWLWLLIAMMVDGVDGTLARRARVKEVLPWFDGGILDILIDYITWTFLPAVFMYTNLPMGPKPLAAVLTVLVLWSSTLCYANEHWKSSDYYFRGFPAAWNIVAVSMYVLHTGTITNVVIVSALVILTMTPTYWTHPFRVKRFMKINIIAIVAWVLSVIWLVAVYPQPGGWVSLGMFWLGGGWFMLSCIIRTVTGEDRPSAKRVNAEPQPQPDHA